jgi:hypothetical protein
MFLSNKLRSAWTRSWCFPLNFTPSSFYTSFLMTSSKAKQRRWSMSFFQTILNRMEMFAYMKILWDLFKYILISLNQGLANFVIPRLAKMVYSKAKLKNNDDKECLCFGPFLIGCKYLLIWTFTYDLFKYILNSLTFRFSNFVITRASETIFVSDPPSLRVRFVCSYTDCCRTLSGCRVAGGAYTALYS